MKQSTVINEQALAAIIAADSRQPLGTLSGTVKITTTSERR